MPKAKRLSLAKGKGSTAHNNREYKAHNVDASRTPDNVTYVRQAIEHAYDELFTRAVEEYNQRARSDRQIRDSYFEHLFGQPPDGQAAKSVLTGRNKQKSFYEELVQIGDMIDTGVGTVDGMLAAKILDIYMRGWQERNPQFHVFNAVLHLDEKTPHLHIDYIPVAESDRGLSKQNGMAKALKQMGYDTKSDKELGFNAWRQNERNVLTELCRAHGVEIAPPEKSRGVSLLPDEYKAQKDAELAELESVKVGMQEEISALRQNAVEAHREVGAAKNELNDLEDKQEGLKRDVEAVEEQILKLEETAVDLEKEIEEKQAKNIELDTERLEIEGKTAGKKLINRALDSIKPTIGGKSTTLKGFSVDETTALLKAAADRADATKRARVAEEKAAAADERLKDIEAREKRAAETLLQAKNIIKQHDGLPAKYNAVIKEKSKLQNELQEEREITDTQREQISDLTVEIRKKDNMHIYEINSLKSAVEFFCNVIMEIVQAMGKLIHGESEYKLTTPTDLQVKLINSIADYAASKVRGKGFAEIAEEIDRNVCVCKAIQDIVDPPPPPVLKPKNRERER